MLIALLLALPLASAQLPTDGTRDVLSTARLGTELTLLREAGNETVVVACGGSEACSVATAIRDAHPSLGLLIVTGARDPLSAEAILRLVDDAQLQCGVWVEGSSAVLRARLIGTCAPVSPPSADTAEARADAEGSPHHWDEVVALPIEPPPRLDEAAAEGWDPIEELVALPSEERHAALLSAIEGVVGDDVATAKIAAALVVSRALAAQERGDHTVVRLFLRAAYADDPYTRALAMRAAGTGGDPPLVRTETTAARRGEADRVASYAESRVVSAPRAIWIDPEALRQYGSERLVRDDLVVHKTRLMGPELVRQAVRTWGVYDGDGAPLIANVFARKVRDGITLADIELEIQSVRTTAMAWGLVGAAALLSGFAVERTTKGYDPGSPAFVGRLTAGAGLLALGSVGLGLSFALPARAKHQRRLVSTYYTPSEADSLIEEYNGSLRDHLGLTEEDTVEYDLEK